jgi:hypothetical protein
MFPEGFPHLVAVTLESWDWDRLPSKDEDIWNALLYPVFLGRTIRSAQASYMKQVLDPLLKKSAAKAVKTDPKWSKTVLKRIDSELAGIVHTPGEGYKKAILNSVVKEAENLNLGRTIGDALSFFENHGVGVELIKKLQKDKHETSELTDYATREIYNVGYTKAVIWMYDCGIAHDLVPPNSHIKRFLTECGYSGFGWSRDEPEDWQIYALACQKMGEVAQEVSKYLRCSVTAKQAQADVWYLQSCRGLLPSSYSRMLSPKVLTNFLESRKWDITKLANRLSDIEKLEILMEELKAFLK